MAACIISLLALHLRSDQSAAHQEQGSRGQVFFSHLIRRGGWVVSPTCSCSATTHPHPWMARSDLVCSLLVLDLALFPTPVPVASHPGSPEFLATVASVGSCYFPRASSSPWEWALLCAWSPRFFINPSQRDLSFLLSPSHPLLTLQRVFFVDGWVNDLAHPNEPYWTKKPANSANSVTSLHSLHFAL